MELERERDTTERKLMTKPNHNNRVASQKPNIYLNVNGTFNFGGTVSPKKQASSAILHSTLRTISPKYIPEIIFSKICIMVEHFKKKNK